MPSQGDTISQRVVDWIDRLLADEDLTQEERVRKRYAWIWLVVSFVGIIGMLLLADYYNMHPILWYGYAMNGGMLMAILLFPIVKQWKTVLLLDLILNTVLNFIVLLQIGGLETSLGFVFNGINNLMASFLIGNRKWTIGLMIAWVLSIIATGLLAPYLTTPDYITPEINLIFFVIDTSWVMPTILILVMFFWQDQSRVERAEAEKLRQLDEAKTKLYTHISHEFRTPLTLIQGIAGQIEKDPKQWLARGVRQIITQSRVLLRLVNQMLDIAKVEAQSMDINPIHGDLSQYVQYVTGLFQGMAESKNICLTFVCQEGPLFTDYDPEKLMQVLDNLISNAINFTSDTGSIEVRVFTTRSNQIAIQVRDSGRGIPKGSLPHIFDRFYQVPDIERQTSGTGLGLALTKELITLMRGRISVESQLGKGSVFTVHLPITSRAPKKADAGISVVKGAHLHEDENEFRLSSDRPFTPVRTAELPILLLVEDNADVIDFLSTLLEDQFVLHTELDGQEGFETAVEIIPDLILTDIMMPRMDGFELIRKLRSDERTDHIPIVVLTAMGDDRSKIQGLQLGADHFLVKPFNEEELHLKLHNLLESRRKMQQKLGMLRWTARPQSAGRYRRELQFLSKVNQILDERYMDATFDISEIYEKVNMSRPQFYRKFTAITDQSIGQYIRSFRLHKAADLIRHNGLNVTEAAYETGFTNVSHFSKSFKEEYGYSPSQLLNPSGPMN